MKKVLIISYGPIHSDPRIIRQVAALKNHYEVTTAGFTPGNVEGVKHVFITEVFREINFYYNFPVPVRKVFSLYYLIFFKAEMKLDAFFRLFPIWRARTNLFKRYVRPEDIQAVTTEAYDVIIANDIFALPLASAVKKKYVGSRIYLDVHEYHMEEQSQSKEWRKFHQPLVKFIFDNYFHNVDTMTTVCEPIAKRYENELDKSVEVITNASFYMELPVRHNTGDMIRMIHHGACMRDREIHLMCDAAVLLGSEYELTIMLVNSEPDYYSWMIETYKGHNNIKFVEPVPVEKIPGAINHYDIGLFLLPPVNYNWENALPNKLYEYVQARLSIVVSPNPAMKQVIENYGLGAVSHHYTAESFAKAIKSLEREKIYTCKLNADKAARELSAEVNLIKIKKIVDNLVLN